jgi:hypothetical protein
VPSKQDALAHLCDDPVGHAVEPTMGNWAAAMLAAVMTWTPLFGDGCRRFSEAFSPSPHVTELSVRPISDDGERIALRVRAGMERPGVGAFDVSWGNRSGLIADGWWPHGAAVKFEHRYPGPGTYRITVVAEGSTEGCRRLQKSKPAALQVRIPLSRASYPPSL